MRLKGKVALVTGSTGGTGAEIAVRYAQEGARVIVTGRAGDRGRDVVGDILASGGQAIFVESDPRSEQSVRRLVARALAGYGRIDVLVNLVEDAAVAVHPMFWCCRYVIPAMAAAGGGSVINLSAPPAAPGAVAALARQLAAAHRDRRVRVNTILVGPADTELSVAQLAVYLAADESAPLTGRELAPVSRVRVGQRGPWPSSTLSTVPVTNSEAGATR